MLSLPADVMSNLARLARAFESIAASLELIAAPSSTPTTAPPRVVIENTCAHCGLINGHAATCKRRRVAKR